MNICACASGEAFKEVSNELGLQVTDEPGTHLGIDGKGCAPAEVDGSNRQSLIHRHEKVSGAENAALIAEGPIKGLAECNADVFDGVVLIHIEITNTRQREIEGAVTGEKLKHVIEEADARRDFILAAAFNGELYRNARLL